MQDKIHYPSTLEEACGLMVSFKSKKEKVSVVYGDSEPDGLSATLSLKNLSGLSPVDPLGNSITFQCGAPIKKVAESIRASSIFSAQPFSLFDPGLTAGHLFTHTTLFTCADLYGMTVILPGGNILRLGSRAFASVSGYQAMEVFLGTKNIIGVPAEYTFRLSPVASEMQRGRYGMDLKEYERQSGDEERKILLTLKNIYDPTHLLNTAVL